MTRPSKPDWTALGTLLDDVKRAWANVAETQRRLAEVTGTGWSPDHMVKVVVGARGQLVDIKIDPRIYRSPDSEGLAAAILAASRAAVDNATGQVREMVEGTAPADLQSAGWMSPELEAMIYGHDADLNRGRDGDG